MDYKEGTYISQGVGENPSEGAISAVSNHDYSTIPDLAISDKDIISRRIEENDFSDTVHGMKNVYCVSLLINDSLVIINIVETNET